MESSRLLLVTGPTVMHLLFHGLLSLRDVSLLIFDDVTGALGQHPYCLVMRYFYTPIKAQQIVVGESVSCQTQLRKPSLILGFALSPEEEGMTSSDIFAKRQSHQRIRAFQRDFHAVLLPPPDNSPIQTIDNRVVIKSVSGEGPIGTQLDYSLVFANNQTISRDAQKG